MCFGVHVSPPPHAGLCAAQRNTNSDGRGNGRKCLVGLRERRGFLYKLYGHSQSKVCTPPSYSAERDVLIVLKIVLAPLKRLKLLGDLCKGDSSCEVSSKGISSVIRVCLNVEDNYFLRTTCKIYNGCLHAHKLNLVYN